MKTNLTMKNITRPYATAFQVRIVSQGKERSRLFSFSLWGGEKKALAAANSWRDQLIVALGVHPRLLTAACKNNLSTGVLGVSRSIKTDKRKDLQYLIYGVAWIDSNGKKRNKEFRVGNVETYSLHMDEKAFNAAKAFRKEYEKYRRCNKLALFEPKKYFTWREKDWSGH